MGMRERAQALAGRFSIINRPEGGTRVTVTLPVKGGVRTVRKAG
jgi:signal transduction histidine kinase